jgi:hypothetical protein
MNPKLIKAFLQREKLSLKAAIIIILALIAASFGALYFK